MLGNTKDALEVLGIIGFVFAIVVVCLYTGWRAYKKAKADAIAAEQARSREIQERIDKAVEAERARLLAMREAEDGRVERLKEIAGEWEKLAMQKRERITYLEAEVTRIREDHERLQIKYNEVVQLNMGLQGTVTALEKRVMQLEESHGSSNRAAENSHC